MPACPEAVLMMNPPRLLSIAGLVGWESLADVGDDVTQESVERTIVLSWKAPSGR